MLMNKFVGATQRQQLRNRKFLKVSISRVINGQLIERVWLPAYQVQYVVANKLSNIVPQCQPT